MTESILDTTISLSLLESMSVDEFINIIRSKLSYPDNELLIWELFSSIANKYQNLRTLTLTSSSILNRSDSSDSINFDKILDLAYSALSAERVVVLKYLEEGDNLVVVATKDDEIKGLTIPINTSEGIYLSIDIQLS